MILYSYYYTSHLINIITGSKFIENSLIEKIFSSTNN